jgi:hypothetical protein
VRSLTIRASSSARPWSPKNSPGGESDITAASIAWRSISAYVASTDHGGSGKLKSPRRSSSARYSSGSRWTWASMRGNARQAGWLRNASTPAIWPGSSSRMCAKACSMFSALICISALRIPRETSWTNFARG